MNRFVDGIQARPLDSTPYTLAQLLSRLGVSREPIEIQQAAVSDWLRTNEPAHFLHIELEYNGFVASNGDSPPDGRG